MTIEHEDQVEVPMHLGRIATRIFVAIALLICASACATARERSYCSPEFDLVAPSASWRDVGRPASAEALLAKQNLIQRDEFRLLHWFAAQDGRVSACVHHRGPTKFGSEYVIFSSADAVTATAEWGGDVELRIAH